LIVVLKPLPRCLSQVLDRGVKAVARGAARCTSQALDRGAQAVAPGAAAMSQQEKNNSVYVQRSRVSITGLSAHW
jgi:uncharacterized protein YoxC